MTFLIGGGEKLTEIAGKRQDSPCRLFLRFPERSGVLEATNAFKSASCRFLEKFMIRFYFLAAHQVKLGSRIPQ